MSNVMSKEMSQEKFPEDVNVNGVSKREDTVSKMSCKSESSSAVAEDNWPAIEIEIIQRELDYERKKSTSKLSTDSRKFLEMKINRLRTRLNRKLEEYNALQEEAEDVTDKLDKMHL